MLLLKSCTCVAYTPNCRKVSWRWLKGQISLNKERLGMQKVKNLHQGLKFPNGNSLRPNRRAQNWSKRLLMFFIMFQNSSCSLLLYIDSMGVHKHAWLLYGTEKSYNKRKNQIREQLWEPWMTILVLDKQLCIIPTSDSHLHILFWKK